MTLSQRAIEAAARAIMKHPEMFTWDIALDLAEAALTAALAVDGVKGWQPIESAPKDATEIDLWMVDQDGSAWREPNAYWVEDRDIDSCSSMSGKRSGWFAPNHSYDFADGWCDVPEYVNRVTGKTIFTKPTHWMMPPQPPAANDGEERR